jgi:alkanesulfonate monooxygenase SsuD/methylene tetrahydromethanopterin reductase-like flavin-dependent oxidoreductase (luciferase family)
VKQAGSSTGYRRGMWAESEFEDLVQYNDGFKTKLIGTKHQIAKRLLLLESLGIDVVLLAFLHYEEDIEIFWTGGAAACEEVRKRGEGEG